MLGWLFSRSSKFNPPVDLIDKTIAQQWIRTFKGKANTQEVLKEKAVAMAPIMKRECQAVTGALSGSKDLEILVRVSYEVLYFYLYLCFLTVAKHCGRESAAKFALAIIGCHVQARDRSTDPSTSDEDAIASLVSDFSDRGNQYAEYTRLLGNGEEEGLFDGVLDLIDTITKNEKSAGR
jgi:hypothetical protein